MTAQRSFGDKRAGLVNSLLYAVGGGFAVRRTITPDVENIRFSQRRERTSLGVRQAIGQAPVLFHRLNLTTSLCAVDHLAALSLLIAFLDVS